MSDSELEIFCCRIADIDATLLAHYEQILDAAEQRRLASFQADTARTAFLISRALLRTTLAARLHCAPTELQFIRDANDKPQLAEPFANWHFNLSHSGAWVTLALSQIGPVGIDVESHERKNNLAGIAQRFFSAEENATLVGLDNTRWLQQFFAIWTIKEAHAKALGCGLSKILSCSSFSVDMNKQSIALTLSAAAAPDSAVLSQLYRLDDSVSLALVQLDAIAATPAIIRSVPLVSENVVALQPLTVGNWSPSR
ncbi:MAG TPA: 4'-phosphopantetheinyl transferase superfamily protein [Spongiibacteraceae bacterium]|nr:4'-phosphopantetheinyl transferase superfamily protein [Spongiibacteraceae bacterium]